MEQVLLFVPINHFALSQPFSPRYSATAANELASIIDSTKYEVDYYDFDARLIKKYRLAMDLPKFNLSLSNVADEMLELLGNKVYDIIICAIPSWEIYLFKQYEALTSCLTLYYLHSLKKTSPNAKIIVGGRGSMSLNSPDIESVEKFFQFKNVADDLKIIDFENPLGIINYINNKEFKLSRINELLEDEEISIFSKKYDTPLHDYIPTKQTNRPKNLEDFRYTFGEIFKYYGYDIPDKEFKDNYIQQAAIYLTNGCRGKCAFCTRGLVDYSSLSFADNTDLIKSYLDQGYNSFFFLDSECNAYIPDLCDWIVRNNIKITWSNSARFKDTNSDFFEMLYEAGCRFLSVGAEQTNDEMLLRMGKNVTVDFMRRKLKTLANTNIFNLLNFIVGYPNETPESVSDTIMFINRNSDLIDSLALNFYSLYSTSPIYNDPERYGIKIVSDPLNVSHVPVHRDDAMYTDQTFDSYDKLNRYKLLIRYFALSILTEDAKKKYMYTPQHLLFALCEIYQDKAKVVNWLHKNLFKPENTIFNLSRLYGQAAPDDKEILYKILNKA